MACLKRFVFVDFAFVGGWVGVLQGAEGLPFVGYVVEFGDEREIDSVPGADSSSEDRKPDVECLDVLGGSIGGEPLKSGL